MTIDKPTRVLRRSRLSFLKEYAITLLLIAVVATLIFYKIEVNKSVVPIMLLTIALLIIYVEIARMQTQYLLTPSQLVTEYGIIKKEKESVFLDNVGNIGIKQGYLQRIFHFGDITITPSAGKEDIVMKGVRTPKKVHNEIERLIKGYMDGKKG